MGLGQRMTDLPQQMHGARRRHGPEPLHQHIEIQPFEKLHHIVERAVRGDPEVIEFNGVIRVERRGGPGFALEAAQYGPANPLVGAEDLRTDQLDGSGPGEHPVPRHPHLAHAAFTQRPHELIAADLPRPVQPLPEAVNGAGDHEGDPGAEIGREQVPAEGVDEGKRGARQAGGL